MKWRTIDTAPKDGTAVLVCRPGYDDKSKPLWPNGPWTAAFQAYHPNSPGKKCWRDQSGHKCEPTHWAPLPPGPAMKGK